jgi:tRNA(Ile2) C34 agmatinyltransferase TiaS
MSASPVCPRCGEGVAATDLKCRACGARVRYKTAREAYGSWGGMGLFDLVPGVRDLPTPLRLLLLIIVVAGLCLIVVPRLVQ